MMLIIAGQCLNFLSNLLRNGIKYIPNIPIEISWMKESTNVDSLIGKWSILESVLDIDSLIDKSCSTAMTIMDNMINGINNLTVG